MKFKILKNLFFYLLFMPLSFWVVSCSGNNKSSSKFKEEIISDFVPPITAVAALGQLSPSGEIRQLAAPISQFGSSPRIVEILVNEGDFVKKGDILAIFENGEKLIADFERNENLIKIINSSIKTKSLIVSQDEHENGVRAILNYGHSFGHVIENLCGYGKFLHGEAISIGMNIAGKIAIDKGLWSKEELERQKNLLKSYDLPTEIPKINKEEVLTILMGDKKVRDGKMRFILPKEIGVVDIYDDVEDSLFLKFFS